MGGSPGTPGSSPAKETATPERGAPGAPRWYSRGYLPHFDSPRVIQHVTFHLADSLPAKVLMRFEEELRIVSPMRRDSERRRKIEAWIDAGHGCCLLQESVAARLVEDALLFFDGERYRLFAWVVMPNHVHVLFQPAEGWALARIMASWKSFTGRRLAPLLPQSSEPMAAGRVWHREYWDRFIRDERHFHAARAYIHDNPVKAGLARRAQDWAWSSARMEWENTSEEATLERGDPEEATLERGDPEEATLERGGPGPEEAFRKLTRPEGVELMTRPATTGWR